jgi:hypothetical protein
MANICPICLLDNTDFKTKCNHYFHKKCLDEWLKIKPICPLCRTCYVETFKHTFCLNIFKKGTITINENNILIKYYFSKNIKIPFIDIIKIICNDVKIIIHCKNHTYKLWTKEGYFILSSFKNHIS